MGWCALRAVGYVTPSSPYAIIPLSIPMKHLREHSVKPEQADINNLPANGKDPIWKMEKIKHYDLFCQLICGTQ